MNNDITLMNTGETIRELCEIRDGTSILTCDFLSVCDVQVIINELCTA